VEVGRERILSTDAVAWTPCGARPLRPPRRYGPAHFGAGVAGHWSDATLRPGPRSSVDRAAVS